MHWEFKKKFDKIDSDSRRDLTQVEIDAFLNEAITIFVETIFSGHNPYGIAIEESQQKIDTLSSLVVKAPMTQSMLTPYSSNSDFGIYEFRLGDLDHEYLHYLGSKVKVTDCDTLFTTKVVSHGELNKYLQDSTWQPSSKWLRTLLTFGESTTANASSVYIYTDGSFEVEGLYLDYLRKPAEVAVATYNDITGSPKTITNCDLPEAFHNQIVDLAVKIAQGVIENNLGFQIADNQTKTNN